MKVYLLIEDWAIDGSGAGVEVETYATRELAEQRLVEKTEVIRASNHYDKLEEVKGDYIDAYMDGWYNHEHEHIYIEESEVREVL